MEVFLETDRLMLRRFVEADIGDLFRLHNDPGVMRFLDGGVPKTHEQIEREYREAFASGGYWAAVERESGEFLGWFVFRSPPGCAPDNFELGYRLRRSAWGRGYATEGSRVLIHRGFVELGVRRVWAQTMAVNGASRRVMERVGLTYVRTFYPDWDDPLPGAEFGEVEYALTKDDWTRRAAV